MPGDGAPALLGPIPHQPCLRMERDLVTTAQDEPGRAFDAEDAALLHGIWQWAKHEADAGAPGGMVAVYVELAVRHLIDDHIGHASSCTECHNNLGTPIADGAQADG